MDHHLNPLAKEIPSYIKDTNDFPLKLQHLDDLSFERLLVTLDVISLYTNIPHQEGLDACRVILNKREVLDPPTEETVNLKHQLFSRGIISSTVCIICRNRELWWGPVWSHLMQISLWQVWAWPFTADDAKTEHLVEVYRWHFCHLATWRVELAALFHPNKFTPSNNQVHRRVV